MTVELEEQPNYRIGRGPRACESLLLKRLRELLPQGRAQNLASPILVVLPSGSLRKQVLRTISSELAPALLGIEVLLLPTLASRILDRAGQPAKPGAEYFDLLVRRAAENEAALKRALEDFEDAYGLCVSSARDLASAHLNRDGIEKIEALLAEVPASDERARAEALCHLVLKVQDQMQQLGFERRGDVLARAAERLNEQGRALLNCSALLIHGFSDAPGQTCDFLGSLLGLPNSEIILDLPPEPSDSTKETRAGDYLRRFARRLGLLVPEEIQAERVSVCKWQSLDAVGREAEVREVAWRIEGFIAQGSKPEDIAVISRDLEGYAPEIRRQFAEIGIPLSGTALGRGFHPAALPTQALCKFLSEGARLGITDFCSLMGARFLGDAGPCARRDLELGLKDLGLSDLGRVAAYPKTDTSDHRAAGFRELPVLRGLSQPEQPHRPSPRLLPLAHLNAAIEAAQALINWHEGRPESASLSEQATSFSGILRTILRQELETAAWLKTLEKLGETPPVLALKKSEFRRLFELALDADFSVALGGRGLGVQVLSLAQARAMTFSKVFILGLNAKCFPAPGREDPILGDTMRECLRPLLPALGRHRDRPEEESYLFAQLMESAGEITLSWMRADDEGKELARSPFVERLVLSGLKSSSTPRMLEERFASARARNASLALRDRQLLTAVKADRNTQVLLRTREIENYRADLGEFADPSWPLAAHVAAAQADVVAEVEATHVGGEGRPRMGRLSPFMGSIGADPLLAESPLWITTLENIARCPWQSFLGRGLRLQVLPDPEIQLPDIDGLLLGNAVHAALQALYQLPGVMAGNRPGADEVVQACKRAAEGVASRAGLNLSGLIGVLQQRARPYVERALQLDWSADAGPRVESTERAFVLEIPKAQGGHRELNFRADRVDQLDEDLLITDYKTGSPISTNKGDESRHEKHLEAISAGTSLQAAAYALAGGRGRYLFIDPDIEDPAAVFEVERSDGLKERFEATTRILERAWSTGLLPPRLEETKGNKEPIACQYCDFEAACIRGDSGSRRRLVALVERQSETDPNSLLADLWDIAGRSQSPSAGENAE